jgi:hypothetical protein
MAYAPGQVFHHKATYGVQQDFYFTLNDPGSTLGDLYNGTGGPFAIGDATISKDGGVDANCANAPAQIAASGFNYRITLTAAELSASRVMVAIRDATASEVFGPATLVIETYGTVTLGSGGVSGGNPWDMVPTGENTSTPTSLLSYGKQIQSLLQRFFGRVTQNSSSQIVYRTDDATALGTMPVSDDGTTQTKGKAV